MPKSRRSASGTTPTTSRSDLSAKVAGARRVHDDDWPLWQGPSAPGPLGGVTQSMLGRFLCCRERFRLKYVRGLEPHPKWNHRLGFGNMWHACDEALAGGVDSDGIVLALHDHTVEVLDRYPLQREEILKWHAVCAVQFPEYVRYWSEHPDVRNRTPLMQEQVFDVPYALPSGRTVRLRGKWDSVDLITDDVRTGESAGIYLQENKTKGDVDVTQVERQLTFDLQTMVYLVALVEGDKQWHDRFSSVEDIPVLGVRYNVVRRPLSGGRGSIRPHKAKSTKTSSTPAETAEDFYERLRRDYIAAEPDYWFMRLRVEVSAQDVETFRQACLDPVLEQLCWWYDEVTAGAPEHCGAPRSAVMGDVAERYGYPPMNYRHPFGVYNALEESGATEYDAYLATGSEAGLTRVESLFTELQP